jgi:hypothetical protein
MGKRFDAMYLGYSIYQISAREWIAEDEDKQLSAHTKVGVKAKIDRAVEEAEKAQKDDA